MIVTDLEQLDCKRGKESCREIRSEFDGAVRLVYTYHTADGTLFSTVARTLEDCRRRRDLWLAGRKVNARA